jgi:hypothetical protein
MKRLFVIGFSFFVKNSSLKNPFVANRTVGARGPSPLRKPNDNYVDYSSERPFWKTTFMFFLFSLSSFLFPLAFALPLQDPIPGTYQCFSSSEGPFEETVQDIGATLEFPDATSYRFTTASASEEGTVSSYTFESDEEMFDAIWQGGSVLQLQPSSGSAPYEGAFFVDNLGAMYVIVQNNNRLYIRCQSEGADIAATFEQIITETAETETSAETVTENETLSTPTETTTSSENLQPLTAVQAGAYACIHTYETTFWSSSDDPSYYEDDDPEIFSLFLFPDGSSLELSDQDTFVSQYDKGVYTFDAATSKLSFQGGILGSVSLTYGTNAEGKAALSFVETWIEDPDGTDKQHVVTYACDYMQDLPPDLGLGLSESTPMIDLANITVAPSTYDPNINHDIEPTPDTYYCYPSFDVLEPGEGYPRYLREYMLEILPNNQYTFDGEAGTFATGVDEYYFQWQSGPLNPTGDIIAGEDDYSPPHNSYVSFDTWGSAITGIDVPQEGEDYSLTIDCFQQGAREQKALLDFALKQPTPASYTCLPSGDNPQPLGLELLPDNRYRFNNEEGSYQTSVQEYNSDIIWDSGPLAGNDTSYSAEESTGIREITFTTTETYGAIVPTGSSTETTLFCQGLVKANLIPKYASSTGTLPPAGTGGLDGFYAKSEFDQGDLINGEPPITTWYFYHFLPNGYVSEDGYVTGDECTKTYPNGLPVCQGYSFANNKITFTDGTAIGLTQADGGDILLDGILYENKTLSGPQTLNARYENVVAYSSPMYMQIGGMGTNSVSTSTYTFSTDGTYSYSFDSWSQTSAPMTFGSDYYGQIGALSSSGSTDSDSGTYTIDGNVITFTSDQGYTTQCGFFFPYKGDTTSVNICGTDYDPPTPE